MANEPIEELFVSIGADTSDLLKDTKKGVGEVEGELGKFEKKGKAAFSGAGAGARRFTESLKRLMRPLQLITKALKILSVVLIALGATLKLFPGLAKKLGDRFGITGERLTKLGRTFGITGAALSKIMRVMRAGAVGGGAIKLFTAGIGTAITAVGALVVAVAAAGAVIGGVLATAFIKFGKAGVAANAQFETFTAQFETLLGSAEAAKERLRELEEFGVETPFELPEIVEASRILEVFGGATLATGDSLRMVGDIAAGVNRPFKEVAMWTGRMFDAMQSGRPFGEASARLQEMGALTGKARRELEDMQKAGASGAELWAKFNDLVGTRFAGNMDRLSGTLKGTTSNLVDLRDKIIRIGGEPLFEEVKESAERFLEILSDDMMTGNLEAIAIAAGDVAAAIVELISTGALDALEGIDTQVLMDFAESLSRAAQAIENFSGEASKLDTEGAFANIVTLMQLLVDSFTITIEGFNRLSEALDGAGAAGAFIGDILSEIGSVLFDMISPVGIVTGLFGDLNQVWAGLTGQSVPEKIEEIAESMVKVEVSAEESAAAMELFFGGAVPAAVEDGVDAVEDGVEAVEDSTEKLKDILSGLGSSFIDLQESTNEQLADLQADHADKMEDLQEKHKEKLSKIAADADNARTKANKNANEDILKLEKETTKERERIISDAKQELATLEKETDKQIEDERENFDTNELRQTEDHLREMRRARQQYLDSLEDVVKNRDARALVDLRRQYQREQDEAKEAFGTGQRRAQEDQDRRLAEIREGEAERADAIIETRERDLQNLIEAENQKRNEIQKTLTDELAQIDIQEQEKVAKEEKSFNERVERENEQFTKRQEELQGALEERLEAEAKALADQEEITEDGARAILEALNETFGIGGDIDELMDAFMERRRAKMLLKIEFESQIGTPPPPGAPGGGSTPMGGAPPATEMFHFQHGGSMVAKRPTMAMFGEAGPELATFTPLSQMKQTTSATKRVEVDINMRGSAPPGIRSADRDEIAGVLVGAMREAGIFAS